MITANKLRPIAKTAEQDYQYNCALALQQRMEDAARDREYRILIWEGYNFHSKNDLDLYEYIEEHEKEISQNVNLEKNKILIISFTIYFLGRNKMFIKRCNHEWHCLGYDWLDGFPRY